MGGFDGTKGRFCNADMQAKIIQTTFRLDGSNEELLKLAITKLGLSARAYDRIAVKTWGRRIPDSYNVFRSASSPPTRVLPRKPLSGFGTIIKARRFKTSPGFLRWQISQFASVFSIISSLFNLLRSRFENPSAQNITCLLLF